ncbi:MAG: MFS transporter [Acidimicrobiia bacterium BACL6 MAG-121220-bin61]|jgi:MFS family permease|nr:MAG: MFS transporter [Acidimicrobiia bacterium BACL6 MAG-120322-bin79]KRO63688.1 MAG: MFS transporter [Acidimicrobiia bacterium BACL6 MAG-121220-bin61]
MFQRIRSAHYAWVIFVVAFITLLGAAGFRSTPGILIDPLGKEFGWSRATVATAVSINVLLFGFIGPFAAALQLRYGLRKVTITALVIISTGALATTQMTHPWHLYILWGGVVGVGSGCMATVFASTVASRWFVKRRGLVTGALTAASASGQLVFLPLLSRIAEQSGWRWVGVVIALCALAVVPVVFLFLRNSPADIGLLPYGASDDFVFATTLENPIRSAFNAFRDAKSDGTFWLLWGSFFVCGFSTNGLIQTHFISAAQDHLLVASVAAGYLALIGGFDVIGTIFSGWLTDRSDPTKLLLVYYLLRGLSLLVLDPMLNMKGWGLLGFMMFYGLDWVATVPPTVALCAQRFGPQRGPLVYGWVFAGHQVGAAVAAFGAGYLRDVTGSYKSSFIISGTGCLIAAYGVTRIDGKTPFNELQPVK